MTAVDLNLLAKELTAAGVPFNGLTAEDNLLENVMTYNDDPVVQTFIPLPPEADPVLAAHDASKPQRTSVFEQAEDSERLALINERAQIDPAFAALVDLTLGTQGVSS
jgi:hypothetical protein